MQFGLEFSAWRAHFHLAGAGAAIAIVRGERDVVDVAVAQLPARGAHLHRTVGVERGIVAEVVLQGEEVRGLQNWHSTSSIKLSRPAEIADAEVSTERHRAAAAARCSAGVEGEVVAEGVHDHPQVRKQVEGVRDALIERGSLTDKPIFVVRGGVLTPDVPANALSGSLLGIGICAPPAPFALA